MKKLLLFITFLFGCGKVRTPNDAVDSYVGKHSSEITRAYQNYIFDPHKRLLTVLINNQVYDFYLNHEDYVIRYTVEPFKDVVNEVLNEG